MYDEQGDKGIVFFVSSWIRDVVRQKLPPEDVAVGKYFLPPSTVYWHRQRPCEPARGPKAPHPEPTEQGLQEARARTEGKEMGARDMDMLWDKMERSIKTVDTES